jgi:hypothetical protein
MNDIISSDEREICVSIKEEDIYAKAAWFFSSHLRNYGGILDECGIDPICACGKHQLSHQGNRGWAIR